MGTLNLTKTYKTDINSILISGVVPRSDNPNKKA